MFLREWGVKMNVAEKFLVHKDASLLFLRIWIAIVYLYHGVPKMLDWGMASEKFVSMGFPGLLGGPIGLIEVVGAILLLTGHWFKWTNWILAGIIVVAFFAVHVPASIASGTLTVGLERDGALAAMFWILSAYGPGKYVLAKK